MATAQRTRNRSRELWGADLMLVFLLGFFPVWIVGILDYHGSRVVAFQRLSWPTSVGVARDARERVPKQAAIADVLRLVPATKART